MSRAAKARCACGIWIIGDRALWATPTCVGCLPPPKKLPIAQAGLVLLVFALLAGCAGTFGGPSRGVEPQLRTSAATVASGLLVVDALQTRWMIGHATTFLTRCPCAPGQPLGFEYAEANPILGERPSKTTVTLYLGLSAAAVIGVRAWAPRWASWVLSGAVIIAEGITVDHNRRLGESPAW